MRPAQIVESRLRCPLAYLPLGAIEWHGVHNPLGLDGLKAHALCVRAAQTGGGIVFPTLWYGEHREIQLMEANKASSTEIAAQLKLPAESFANGYMRQGTPIDRTCDYLKLLTHCLNQIRSYGYQAIFVLCGHYPLRVYAELAGQVFSRDTGIPVRAVAEHELVQDLPLAKCIGDHAGQWETSLLLALEAELTDLSELSRNKDAAGVGIEGIDPSTSDAKLGEKAVNAIVDVMVREARSLLPPAQQG